MTIDELISRLEEYREDCGGDVEVLLMTQQQWPFENAIRGVCTREEILQHSSGDDDDEEEEEGEANVVFLVEGEQLCYGSKTAWDVIG